MVAVARCRLACTAQKQWRDAAQAGMAQQQTREFSAGIAADARHRNMRGAMHWVHCPHEAVSVDVFMYS